MITTKAPRHQGTTVSTKRCRPARLARQADGSRLEAFKSRSFLASWHLGGGISAFALVLALVASGAQAQLRGTGDLGIVIERAAGSVQVLDTSARAAIARVQGLGDLSHASAVYSRDARYAFVFGRDGGLTKIDLLTARIEARILQAGNSIGGAISQDGRVV